MNLNLPLTKDQIKNLLIESETFRNAVAEKMTFNYLRDKIEPNWKKIEFGWAALKDTY